MKIDIITLFPKMFSGPFEQSIVKRAQDKGLVEINIHDLRTFGEGERKTVDDRPYGGGVGSERFARRQRGREDPEPLDHVLRRSFLCPGLVDDLYRLSLYQPVPSIEGRNLGRRSHSRRRAHSPCDGPGRPAGGGRSAGSR